VIDSAVASVVLGLVSGSGDADKDFRRRNFARLRRRGAVNVGIASALVTGSFVDGISAEVGGAVVRGSIVGGSAVVVVVVVVVGASASFVGVSTVGIVASGFCIGSDMVNICCRVL
jgi:hypothetical protein